MSGNLSKPLKVAHVVELSRGGPTTAVLQLLNHQSNSPDYMQPALIACRNLLSDELAAASRETHLYTSSRNPLKFRAVAAEVGALFEEIRPDVIHLHSTFPGVYGRLALRGKVKRPKVIYCPHGWSFAQEAPFLKKWIYGAVERALLPQTDAILNISAHEETLARHWRVTTPNDALVHHGVADIDNGQAADLGLDPTKINIGFIGRLDRQKGLDLLLKALNQTPRPWLNLTVIGAKLRDNDTADFDAAGIRQIDWVPYAEIDSHIRAFDAMIMPSRWEGFSYTPLEAMRNGKPVVVSNRTSLPEVVIDGYNGTVFDLDAPGALDRALDQLAVLDLKAMGRNARHVFEQTYSEPPVLAALDRFYTRVVAGTRSLDCNVKKERTS
jgi:glycosyltransferase involved in cell wall biosynthesis